MASIDAVGALKPSRVTDTAIRDESAYYLFTASVLCVAVARPVTFWPFMFRGVRPAVISF